MELILRAINIAEDISMFKPFHKVTATDPDSNSLISYRLNYELNNQPSMIIGFDEHGSPVNQSIVQVSL